MQENIPELLTSRSLGDPHQFLGLCTSPDGKQTIRLWRPGLDKCQLEITGELHEAKKVDEVGLFELEVSTQIAPHEYRIHHLEDEPHHDPYAFSSAFGELDIHLLNKGLHYELYNHMGATPKTHQGVEGVHFSVWAPNAKAVSLVGEFNKWDGLWTPMRLVEGAGVWEIFMPGMRLETKYLFEIVTQKGETIRKCDPVAHFSEMRPNHSSIVFDVDRYEWGDEKWMEQRADVHALDAPINIYEVHLASWQKNKGHFHSYRELAEQLAAYCKTMHYTHVELIGICEHPLDESWGYQVTGYFAPTSRHGTPEDFQFFVDHLHQEGIGVILDWVPAHFPSDAHSIAQFDGTHLYEHKDPRQGFHPHWNTHIFNYGRWEVSNFLIASALFWLQKMHVDGLRVDAVSSMLYLDYGRKKGEWIPNKLGTNINLEAVEFLKHLNSIVHQVCPSCLMIAEEASAYPGVTLPVAEGGLGFDLKWNMGWMNDTLSFFSLPCKEREKLFSQFIFITDYAFKERYALVLSHDEVVHEKKSLYNKMPGDDAEKMQHMRLLLSFMMCFPGKKLLFMGGELGQVTEWNEQAEISWDLLKQTRHKELHEMIKKLNALYTECRLPLAEGAYTWLVKEEGVLAYKCCNLVFAHNFLDKPAPFAFSEGARLLFSSNSEESGAHDILRPLATYVFIIDE